MTDEPQYLVDTSALLRLIRNPTVLELWHRTVAKGLVATCDITELELLYTARSKADRDHQEALIRQIFS